MTRRSKPPIAIYSALADATRCRIIEILLAGPIPVHTLADAFSISRPAISRHLRVLKTAGLVAEVRKGRENLYALRPAKLTPAINWIGTILPAAGQPLEQATPEPEPVPTTATRKASRPARTAAGKAPTPAIMRVEAEPGQPQKPPRPVPPEPAISQMGFDF